jgi:proline iminopeptidase
VFFDQRGAGRSWPPGETEANTTPDLVADVERIREVLDIPAWILFGDGWGAALALAYAQLFPERVLGLVLRDARLQPGVPPRGHPVADAVCAHYRRHGGFLLASRLLADIAQVRHLPAVLVCPADDAANAAADDAARLRAAWPELAVVAVPGPAGSEAMARASVQALTWMAGWAALAEEE